MLYLSLLFVNRNSQLFNQQRQVSIEFVKEMRNQILNVVLGRHDHFESAHIFVQGILFLDVDRCVVEAFAYRSIGKKLNECLLLVLLLRTRCILVYIAVA